MISRCRKEVNEVIGSKSEITSDDVTKLKYTSCVFKEALRLYPPAPQISRVTTDELNADGLIIPPGTLMNVNEFYRDFKSQIAIYYFFLSTFSSLRTSLVDLKNSFQIAWNSNQRGL